MWARERPVEAEFGQGTNYLFQTTTTFILCLLYLNFKRHDEYSIDISALRCIQSIFQLICLESSSRGKNDSISSDNMRGCAPSHSPVLAVSRTITGKRLEMTIMISTIRGGDNQHLTIILIENMIGEFQGASCGSQQLSNSSKSGRAILRSFAIAIGSVLISITV